LSGDCQATVNKWQCHCWVLLHSDCDLITTVLLISWRQIFCVYLCGCVYVCACACVCVS